MCMLGYYKCLPAAHTLPNQELSRCKATSPAPPWIGTWVNNFARNLLIIQVWAFVQHRGPCKVESHGASKFQKRGENLHPSRVSKAVPTATAPHIRTDGSTIC